MFLLAFAVSACGGDDEADKSIDIFCAASCGRGVSCLQGDSTSRCESSCRGEATGVDFYRSEAVAAVGQCIRRIDCDSFFDDGAFEPCWEGVQASISPSEATRAFCEGFSRSWFECGGWYAQTECEQDWAMWSDATLARLDACNQPSDCAALDACIDAVIAEGP